LPDKLLCVYVCVTAHSKYISQLPIICMNEMRMHTDGVETAQWRCCLDRGRTDLAQRDHLVMQLI